ncbi:MAG: RcpC/CpaB family pilus assembly protein [Thermoguttaceae bacterium]
MILWAVGSASTAEPSPETGRGSPAAAEWMRGVPRGFRLVALELAEPGSLSPGERVDVVWDYAVSERQQETSPLVEDAGVLAAEASKSAKGAGPVVRVVMAVTPHQAGRLKLAAAISSLRVRTVPSPGQRSARNWNVRGIEDRTQAIEASLADSGAGNRTLERPTLAPPAGTVGSGSRGSIAVPVEIDRRR